MFSFLNLESENNCPAIAELIKTAKFDVWLTDSCVLTFPFRALQQLSKCTVVVSAAFIRHARKTPTNAFK